MPRPRVTVRRNGSTSSGPSGPPKETTRTASYGASGAGFGAAGGTSSILAASRQTRRGWCNDRVLTSTAAQTLARNSPWLVTKPVRNTGAVCAAVFRTGFVTSQGLFLAKVCATAIVVSLPVLIAGFAAQDKLLQGLSLGAVK